MSISHQGFVFLGQKALHVFKHHSSLQSFTNVSEHGVLEACTYIRSIG